MGVLLPIIDCPAFLWPAQLSLQLPRTFNQKSTLGRQIGPHRGVLDGLDLDLAADFANLLEKQRVSCSELWPTGFLGRLIFFGLARIEDSEFDGRVVRTLVPALQYDGVMAEQAAQESKTRTRGALWGRSALVAKTA